MDADGSGEVAELYDDVMQPLRKVTQSQSDQRSRAIGFSRALFDGQHCLQLPAIAKVTHRNRRAAEVVERLLEINDTRDLATVDVDDEVATSDACLRCGAWIVEVIDVDPEFRLLHRVELCIVALARLQLGCAYSGKADPGRLMRAASVVRFSTAEATVRVERRGVARAWAGTVGAS